MIGTILRQRYKIVEQLGAGGFSETYIAEDLDIPTTPKPICVVKRLQSTAIDPEIIRLFEQEAQILYQLGENHPQIPTLYAFFQDNQEFYLIQEFIDGADLSKEITPGKQLSESYVIKLLQDVLEILVYVHENKVIHRDIKPTNIMRRQDGELVLIDFGVVKQINTTIAIKSGLTSQTVGIGTPGYMPCEQSIGKPKFSSDIYALGMTGILALTGLSPHLLPEDDDGEVVWSQGIAVSDKLSSFLTKMVRYDWRQRYKNATDALEALHEALGIIKQQNIQSGNRSLLPVFKLIQIQLNRKWGFISRGKLVIPCQYDSASSFSEGLAGVMMGAKWGFINTSGELAINYQFDGISNFSEGLASVRVGEKWGYINSSGQLITPIQFDSASPFCEGLANVEIKGKWGYINTKGQMVIPCQFYSHCSCDFQEGFAGIKIAEKWGFINIKGQVVIPYEFDDVGNFSKGLARVTIGSKWGYINSKGQLIIHYQFDYAYSFQKESLAIVSKWGKLGCINTNGQLVTPYQFNRIERFQEGLARVEIGEKWGFINIKGRLVIACQFDWANSFFESLASVKLKGKWGYINTNGQLVIPCRFDAAGNFSEGLASVEIGGKLGFINTNGQLVIPYQFDGTHGEVELEGFQQGLAKVKINGKEHLIDQAGNIIY